MATEDEASVEKMEREMSNAHDARWPSATSATSAPSKTLPVTLTTSVLNGKGVRWRGAMSPSIQ